MAVFAEQV